MYAYAVHCILITFRANKRFFFSFRIPALSSIVMEVTQVKYSRNSALIAGFIILD